MKVYLEPFTNSRGIQRVKYNLIKYAPPEIEIVDFPDKADLEIIHVWGRHDSIERRIEELKSKPFAMIQYVLRSSMKPNSNDWFQMWNKAKIVWSYYDLHKLAEEDVMNIQHIPYFDHYYAPLGVSHSVFKESNWGSERRYIVGASSQHALSESARECAIATQMVKKNMFFLGHELRRGLSIDCHTGLTDHQVAQYFSLCTFISGLRRTEGFELPVIEGALCGAVPIVFDRPEMHHWFNDFAIFIKEGSRDEVIYQLQNIFRSENVSPINEDQKQIIRDRFNWKTIIKGFWEKVL